MTDPHPGHSLAYRSVIAALPAILLWLIAASPVLAADSVPSGARDVPRQESWTDSASDRLGSGDAR